MPKKPRNLLASLLLLVILTTSAAGCGASSSSSTAAESIQTAATATVSTNQDTVPDYSAATAIVLGDQVSINGSGAAFSGSTVSITAGGSYTISGTLTNGKVEVNTTEKVNLELNGVTIANSSGPAVCITNAKKATLTLKSGTNNTLTDGGQDTENDAALFSNDTLVINGEGTLIVTGNNMEAIGGDDDIIVQSGTIRVTAKDDGINAHDDITISGGYVYINSVGDGIDSNGTINISGGTIISLGGLAGGDGGVDADGAINITGGTIIATGSSFGSPSTSSTQKTLLVNFNGTQAANTLVSIQQAGQNLLTLAPAKNFPVLFYSSNQLTEGVSYEVYTGGSATGIQVDGLYSSTATYSGGTLATSVTTDSINSQQQGPGGGGMRMPPGARPQ